MILSFRLVGLWTMRVKSSGALHWVQFTLAGKGYDNHNCRNKLQTGNVAGVWMTSCPEEMCCEFGRFWKNHDSWVPTLVLRSWVPTMVWRNWCSTIELRNWDWTTRCAECRSVVSIEWCKRLLRNFSLLVSKLIKPFVPEQLESAGIFIF